MIVSCVLCIQKKKKTLHETAMLHTTYASPGYTFVFYNNFAYVYRQGGTNSKIKHANS